MIPTTKFVKKGVENIEEQNLDGDEEMAQRIFERFHQLLQRDNDC
jgi:hypothetical protein